MHWFLIAAVVVVLAIIVRGRLWRMGLRKQAAKAWERRADDAQVEMEAIRDAIMEIGVEDGKLREQVFRRTMAALCWLGSPTGALLRMGLSAKEGRVLPPPQHAVLRRWVTELRELGLTREQVEPVANLMPFAASDYVGVGSYVEGDPTWRGWYMHMFGETRPRESAVVWAKMLLQAEWDPLIAKLLMQPGVTEEALAELVRGFRNRPEEFQAFLERELPRR